MTAPRRRQPLSALVSPPPVTRPRDPRSAEEIRAAARAARNAHDARIAEHDARAAEHDAWMAQYRQDQEARRRQETQRHEIWLAQLDLRIARSWAASEERLRQYRRDTDTQLWAMKMRLDQQIWNMSMDLRYRCLRQPARPVP